MSDMFLFDLQDKDKVVSTLGKTENT